MNRYFIRCTDCLTVAALDAETHPAMSYSRLVARCGCCDGASTLELMGRVERDRLVHDRERCACDERCTSARGPLCVCQCGGKNHGAGILAVIHYTVDAGAVPVLRGRSTEKHAAMARNFRDALADARAVRDAYADRRKRGEYLPPADYERFRHVMRACVKASESRDHRARMRVLEPFRRPPQLDATPEEARAILAELHAYTSADTGPIADVPFRLSSTVSTKAPKQESLF